MHPWLRSGLLIAFACAGAACEVEHGGGWGGPPPGEHPPTDTPAQVTIDADQTLAVKPGEGVGVFIEYTTGGHWRVYTSCDFNVPTNPGYACAFDVFATPLDATVTLSNAAGQELAGKDVIAQHADGSLHLQTDTTVGLDGMTFDAPPGAAVEIEAYLDADADPRFIYWMSEGVIHQGAPTNPIDITPNEPAPPAGDPSGGTAP